MRRARLTEIELPDFGMPETEPALSRDIYAARLDRPRGAMRSAGYDGVVIYGDREHMANICWASALLVVLADGDGHAGDLRPPERNT